jgi:Fe-S-cluster containining protein
VDFTYPANASFDCNRCGLCCGDTQQKTRHILVLETEANNISAQTSLPIQDFAKQIIDKTPYRYEMKKTDQGKCFFLKDNQCSIYSSRPLICRFYPFELKFDCDKGYHVFNFTLECPSIHKGKTITMKDFEELFTLAQARLG